MSSSARLLCLVSASRTLFQARAWAWTYYVGFYPARIYRARSVQPEDPWCDATLLPCAPFVHYRAHGQSRPDVEFRATPGSSLPRPWSVPAWWRFERRSLPRWQCHPLCARVDWATAMERERTIHPWAHLWRGIDDSGS